MPRDNKEPRLTKGQQARKLDSEKVFDPTTTKDDLIQDLLRLQDENPFSEISRDFYRLNGVHSERTWLKHFGRWSAFKEAANLAPNKMQKRVNSNIAHQSHLDIYRQFYNEEVLPYVNLYPKSPKDPRYAEIAVCSDIHDVHADPFVLSAFIEMCRIKQPDIIVLNGDIFDNYEASLKYSIDLRKFIPVERFIFVQEHVFGALRKACPNAQIDFIPGNHELRILHLLASMPNIVRVWLADCLGLTLADWFGLHKYEINMYCKFDLAAFSDKEVKDQLDENFKVYFDCWVAHHTHNDDFGMAGTSGHTHRPEQKQSSNLSMGSFDWMITGCIKKLRAEYVAGRNKWTQGFGYVYIDTVARRVQQIPYNIHGDFVVIDGYRFTRTKTGAQLA